MVWLSLRLVKFIGLTVLGAGLGTSLLSRSGAERMRAACWLTGTGMMLTWCAGYGMVQSTGRFVGEPFILVGVALSLLAHLDVLLYARRPSALSAALTVGGMCGAVAAMVLRPAETAGLLPILGIAVVTGAVGGFLLRHEEEVAAPESAAIISRWFLWVARLEGLSLLSLLFVVMPLKHLGGLYDGGWTGWIHGALFMQYGLALLLISRAKDWGWWRVCGGLLAGLLPGGTFVFEVLTQPDR